MFSRIHIVIVNKLDIKMATTPRVYLIISCISYLYILTSSQQALCNPLAFNPMFAYSPAFQPAPIQNPIMITPQYDPYVAMQSQYMMAQPMNLWPYDASRRSLPGMFGKMNENKAGPQNELETDEQRALDGLPPSLVSANPIKNMQDLAHLKITIINISPP